ncbi:MAG: hypothetical protein IPO48_09135 [Saprospiraceae bacterium]|nr:hypothetical protein [Saprospiraceae bacterium]
MVSESHWYPMADLADLSESYFNVVLVVSGEDAALSAKVLKPYILGFSKRQKLTAQGSLYDKNIFWRRTKK